MRRPPFIFRIPIFLIICFLVIYLASFTRQTILFLPFSKYILGINQPTSYLILLGNDAEMRANGGFAGSYAKLLLSSKIDCLKTGVLKIENCKLKITPNLSFEDIYVPNGQLKGFVAPPEPIQQAFQHGSWELANADWEPDFPTSATTLRWFMEKGNEINPDLLAIMNLSTIKKVLDIVGSFPVPEFEAEITPDNFYLFLQSKAELDFFPGSTQKKDALTAVGNSLSANILSLPLTKKIQIAQILYQDLKNQNIVVNSQNEAFQTLLERQNFAGKLGSTTTDTYLLVETNLGANKANTFITRNTTHTVFFDDNIATHKAVIELTNSSPEANPNPPFHYGGDYIAFLRFYLPPQAIDIAIENRPLKIENYSQASNFGFTEIGFWLTVPSQNQNQITLTYTLPVSPKDYSLAILKQHGLVSSPQTITINGKTYSTSLKNDFILHP